MNVRPGSLGAWIAGARLRTLPAVAAPVLMGGGLAWKDGGFSAGPFLVALVGGLLIQAGTNFSNDLSDFVRGVDAPGRAGPPRVAASGLLTANSIRAGAAVCFLLAAVAGAYLIRVGGWPVVWIGLAAIASGICYTGGPWPFGYHGLGDLFVFVFFGPVATAGAYYVQALRWTPEAVFAGIGVGALATAILVVNNLRDRTTDAEAGKRTLAVSLGESATRAEYALLLAVAAVIPPVGAVAGWWPPAVSVACGGLLLALAPLRTVWRYEDPRVLNEALAATARATGAYGLLFAAGCLA